MIIFPAIDIKNKNVVRLKQGDFNRLNTYNLTPLEAALSYQKDGATWLHMIDLDGAEKGENSNQDVIQNIAINTELNIQVGGGVRTKEKIIELLSIGVTRVIVGTFAIENFETLKELVQKYPKQIIVSLDSKDGYITTKGWQETTTIKTIDFIKDLEAIGIDTIVVTDIAKDGMMEGPNFNQLKTINEATQMNVIASGGVSSLKDIIKLSEYNLYGAIIGKALYINEIDLKEAIKCSLEESSLV